MINIHSFPCSEYQVLVHHPVDTKRQPHYKLIQCKLQARVKTYLLTLIVVNLHFCCFHHNFPKNKKKCKKQYHYTAAKTCEPLQWLHTLMSPSPVTVIEKLVKANSWINFFPGLLFSWGNVFLVSCVKHIQHSCAFWHREKWWWWWQINVSKIWRWLKQLTSQFQWSEQ